MEVLDLVQQLTESYISRPNTIILTTIPMSGNQTLRCPEILLMAMYPFRRYAEPAIRKISEGGRSRGRAHSRFVDI